MVFYAFIMVYSGGDLFFRPGKQSEPVVCCRFSDRVAGHTERVFDGICRADAAGSVSSDIPGFLYDINSWMTAVLYLGIPFCFITLAMCFNETDERRPAVFCSVQIFTAILIAVLMIIFLPWKFKLYQQTSPAFWYSMSVLNLGYGLAGTVMMVRAVRNERREQSEEEKNF